MLITENLQDLLQRLDACQPAQDWAKSYSTLAKAYSFCPMASWMFWIYNELRIPVNEDRLRLFNCWCARDTPLLDGRKVWDLLPNDQSKQAVEMGEKFIHKQISLEELLATRAVTNRSVRHIASHAIEQDTNLAKASWYAAVTAAECVSECNTWPDGKWAIWAVTRSTEGTANIIQAVKIAEQAQANALRRIMGNPFTD